MGLTVFYILSALNTPEVFWKKILSHTKSLVEGDKRIFSSSWIKEVAYPNQLFYGTFMIVLNPDFLRTITEL